MSQRTHATHPPVEMVGLVPQRLRVSAVLALQDLQAHLVQRRILCAILNPVRMGASVYHSLMGDMCATACKVSLTVCFKATRIDVHFEFKMKKLFVKTIENLPVALKVLLAGSQLIQN